MLVLVRNGLLLLYYNFIYMVKIGRLSIRERYMDGFMGMDIKYIDIYILS